MCAVDLDARLTPSQAARLAGVSRQAFNWWRSQGYVVPGADGKYRALDVLMVDRDVRSSGYSHRRNDPAGQRSLRAG